MRASAGLLFVVLALGGCLGEAVEPGQAAIVRGRVEPGYPAVGYLGRSADGQCTATQVANRVIVTAKHCVREGQDPESLWFHSDTDSAGYSPRGIKIFHDGRLPRDESDVEAFDEDDVVAVALSHSTNTHVMPYVTHELTTLAQGEGVVLVGYGKQSLEEDSYLKRSGDATIAELLQAPSGLTTTGGTEATACYGDSGGPMIWAGVMVGVLSGFADQWRWWMPWRSPDYCDTSGGMYFQIGPYAHLIDAAIAYVAQH